MKSTLTALKLLALCSIPLLSGYAFSYTYLSCVDEGKNYQGDSYAHNEYSKNSNEGGGNRDVKNAFGDFIKLYGAAAPNKHSVDLYKNTLYMLGTPTMSENLSGDSNSDEKYLIFDNDTLAKSFCDGLAKFCTDEYGSKYKYAMGGAPGFGKLLYITVYFRNSGLVNKSVCAAPDYKDFPNSGGSFPGGGLK